MDPFTYQKAGVDPHKAAQAIASFAAYLQTRPKDPNILSGVGPFASCYSLKGYGVDHLVMVTCCDGVGTKLKLALEWKDLSSLGTDLVAMNVNDCLCVGALPAVFLDYYSCSALKTEDYLALLKGIQQACETSGCSLVGGETAEMPGLYQNGDFDLAGFTVGFAHRENLLGPNKVEVGDRLLAIGSSGFHSNGYSLVRKLVEREKIRPEDRPEFDSRTWREILLAPTHIYVGAVKPLLTKAHALAHITGGGLYENLPRVLPEQVSAKILSESWQLPPLFQWAQNAAHLSQEQLLSTFNCGVGMIVICSAEDTTPFQHQIESSGHTCWEIGEIIPRAAQESAVLWT